MLSTCTEILDWLVRLCRVFAMSILFIVLHRSIYLRRLFLEADIFTSPGIEKCFWEDDRSMGKLSRDLFCVSSVQFCKHTFFGGSAHFKNF